MRRFAAPYRRSQEEGLAAAGRRRDALGELRSAMRAVVALYDEAHALFHRLEAELATHAAARGLDPDWATWLLHP